MADRFYCSDLGGTQAVLLDAEAHHAAHVMRIATGQPVELFDGRGTSASAVVTRVGRREVTLEIVDRVEHTRPSEGRLTVAACPPKGDRLKWMIEKLTEVGVDCYVPLISERTVVSPGRNKVEKLGATVVAAAKQSGRDWLMEIATPTAFPDLLDNIAGSDERLLIAHPGEKAGLPTGAAGNTTLLIGPEGGFAEHEVDVAVARGAEPVSRPGPILRTETAAVAFAVLATPEARGSESG